MFDTWVSDHTDSYDPYWTDYAGYIDASKKAKATVNIAFQIGHASLRLAVMGQEDRPPTADELTEMKR